MSQLLEFSNLMSHIFDIHILISATTRNVKTKRYKSQKKKFIMQKFHAIRQNLQIIYVLSQNH